MLAAHRPIAAQISAAPVDRAHVLANLGAAFNVAHSAALRQRHNMVACILHLLHVLDLLRCHVDLLHLSSVGMSYHLGDRYTLGHTVFISWVQGLLSAHHICYKNASLHLRLCLCLCLRVISYRDLHLYTLIIVLVVSVVASRVV